MQCGFDELSSYPSCKRLAWAMQESDHGLPRFGQPSDLRCAMFVGLVTRIQIRKRLASP